MQKTAKRILIVDDEPDILEFLRIILEEGYEVVTSEKGEFLEQLHNDRLPHLFLVDVLLSGKDGRAIRNIVMASPENFSGPGLEGISTLLPWRLVHLRSFSA